MSESKSGFVSVTRTYKEGGVVSSEDSSEDTIDVRVFEGPTATIGHNARMTISLPNYESVQVGVHCSLPCHIEELGEAYQAAKTFVDKKLNEEVAQIREYRKTLK
jgi:hypothetical protein